MKNVRALNRTNRPFYFTKSDGTRLVIPSRGVGQGNLEVVELGKFLQMAATKEFVSVAPFPVVVEFPAVSGDLTVGSELSVSNGTWDENPTAFTYQWFSAPTAASSLVAIAGQTTNKLTLTSGNVDQYIACSVSASNAAGSTTAFTTRVGPVTV